MRSTIRNQCAIRNQCVIRERVAQSAVLPTSRTWSSKEDSLLPVPGKLLQKIWNVVHRAIGNENRTGSNYGSSQEHILSVFELMAKVLASKSRYGGK